MFSVVIPAYNAQGVIAKAIQSVLDQTYGDFQIIVVDDGSDDGTKGVVKSMDDPRITYIYQKNQGVSAARNRGIMAAEREYICFLDADDQWKEDHLATLRDLIAEYDQCGMYTTGYEIHLNNDTVIHKTQDAFRTLKEEHFRSENGFETILRYGYFLNTNTICCRKCVFDKVGLFAEGVDHGEDDDMWYRIFAYASVAISKKTTTIYDRTNSVATGRRTEVFQPVFLERVPAILDSQEVPAARKESLLIWVEVSRLSQARKHILAGEKKKAWRLLGKVNVAKVSKRKYMETLLCMFLPWKLVRKVIDRRDAGYYRE